MASHDSTALRQARVARQAFDKSQTVPRGGSIGLVLAIAIVLTIAAGGLIYVSRDYVEVYVLILLAVLGTIGVFALFRTPARLTNPDGREHDSPIPKSVVDGPFEGIP